MPDSSPLVVAVDQGTSSTKAVVVNRAGIVVASATVPVGQQHPKAGWVEQNAEELVECVVAAVGTAIESVEGRIVAVGLSTQRESAVLWDRATGEPLGPGLGWQDRRTTPAAERLIAAGEGDRVRSVTGLPIDPMFSALKFAWLLDRVDPDRSRSKAGELALGTVDSWLLFTLTGEHRIEAGNASRTQLLDLATVDWDDDLLELFDVPRAALPRVASSTEPSSPVTGISGLPANTRIHAVLGDSHAALFGHGVREPGAVKVTYGTGSSVMGLSAGVTTADGLVRTIAWQDDAGAAYAFEGNILSTGATLVWLAGILGTTPTGIVELAATAGADHGVEFVPAFAGLGAPWWDEQAQALISGIGLGTGSSALARAAVESIALQVEDVLVAADANLVDDIDTILVDGGPAANDWLVQLQADLSQRVVIRPSVPELSAIGAAHLAGIGAGVWTEAQVRALPRDSTTFRPRLDAERARARRTSWLGAVARARSSASPSPALQRSTP